MTHRIWDVSKFRWFRNSSFVHGQARLSHGQVRFVHGHALASNSFSPKADTMHKTRKTKTLNCWNTKFNTGYQLGFCVNDVSKVCVKVGICVIIIFLVKNTFAERWPRQITKWAQSLLFKITYQAFLKIRNNHVSISCHMVYSHVIYVTWKLTNYKKYLFKFEDLRF